MGLDRFASPVQPLSGCYVFEYGDWPPAALRLEAPDPGALPPVLELSTRRVGSTPEASIDGRMYEVRSHGRSARPVLHYWRMVGPDSLVVWTGGPVGFILHVGVDRQNAAGSVLVKTEGESGVSGLGTSLSGIRAPCPRNLPRP